VRVLARSASKSSVLVLVLVLGSPLSDSCILDPIVASLCLAVACTFNHFRGAMAILGAAVCARILGLILLAGVEEVDSGEDGRDVLSPLKVAIRGASTVGGGVKRCVGGGGLELLAFAVAAMLLAEAPPLDAAA